MQRTPLTIIGILDEYYVSFTWNLICGMLCLFNVNLKRKGCPNIADNLYVKLRNKNLLSYSELFSYKYIVCFNGNYIHTTFKSIYINSNFI